VSTVVAPLPPPVQPSADDASARWSRSAWIPVASVGGVILLAIWNSYHKSLWIDEAYALSTANRSLRGTWHQALHFEQQPPLYYVLLNLWIRLGPKTVHWMRALSTVCAAGCVLFVWTTRPHAASRRGVPAPILAMVTGTVVWAAAEARPYALALFFSAWTMYFFVRILDRDDRSWRDAALYAIGAYAGILAFYYVGFLLAGQWVASVAVRRGWRRLTIALAAVAVALAPWLPVVHDQLTENVNPTPAVVFNPAMRFLAGGPATNLPSAFLAAMFGDAPVLTQTSFGTVVIGALLLLVVGLRFAVPDGRAPRVRDCVRLLSRRRPSDSQSPDQDAAASGWLEPALVITLAIPSICLLGLQASNIVPVYPRHMVCLTAPFILLCALWTAHIAPGIWRWVGGTAVLLAATLTLVSFERHVDVADSRGAAAYVVAHGEPDEPVLVVGPEAVLAFRYYYSLDRGRAQVFGIPIDAPLDVYDPSRFDLHDTAQIGARVRDARVQQRFWMVVSQGFVWRIGLADSIVTRYLRTHASVLDSADFTNMYVIHAVMR
jgi:hypothetical protein